MELAEALAQIDLMQGHIAALEQQVQARDEALRELRVQLQLRDHQLARLRRALFGDKSERFAPETATPILPGLDLEPAAANDDGANDAAPPPEADEPKAKVREHERSLGGKPRRPPLELDPARVRDEHRHVFPEQTTCGCCGAQLTDIGEETQEVVERLVARWLRITTHRHRLACAACKQGGVHIALPEDPPASGSGPVGLSLAVDIGVMHFADHLPFHRMAGIFEREGLRIDRATLSRVAGRVADALSPVVECMEAEVLDGDRVLGMDGTGIKILAKPHCVRRTVYVLHGDGHVVFRALKTATADKVLSGFGLFRGIAVADAASVHLGAVGAGLRLRIALCNAHARRRFFEARATDRERAEHMLRFYRRVAFFERSWADLDPAARRQERHEVLAPKFAEVKRWALEQVELVSPRTPIAGALQYLLAHFDGLTVFLEDGRVPWTNNTSERLLRHIAVGRRAWMFRGTFEGAERGCVLWSLMQSCRALGIDPRRYLIDTLAALSETTRNDLWTLTPKAYAARQNAALAAA